MPLAFQHYVYRDKAGEIMLEIDATDIVAAELYFIEQFGYEAVKLAKVEIEPCSGK